ncbi:MAG: hypothetical protein ACE5HI_12300 [bacterium]
MKNYFFDTRWIVLLFMVIICHNTAYTDEPKDPPLTEHLIFNARLHRLQTHKAQLPTTVDDVIKSLTEMVEVTFDCPQGARVNKVTVNIHTKQIKWDKNLTIHEKKVEIPANAVGYYIWHPTIDMARGEKTIKANNFIMFDPNITERQERNPLLSLLADEALLFHEFLHGQLLIDAMSEKEWQDRICDCTFDFSPQDAYHEQIPELVLRYLQNLAALDVRVYAVNAPAQPAAESGGAFEVVIADARILENQEHWRALSYYPELSNVDPASFNVRIRKGKIVATGKLIDKSHKGFVIVYFAPGK